MDSAASILSSLRIFEIQVRTCYNTVIFIGGGNNIFGSYVPMLFGLLNGLFSVNMTLKSPFKVQIALFRLLILPVFTEFKYLKQDPENWAITAKNLHFCRKTTVFPHFKNSLQNLKMMLLSPFKERIVLFCVFCHPVFTEFKYLNLFLRYCNFWGLFALLWYTFYLTGIPRQKSHAIFISNKSVDGFLSQ